jgi:hypothetical protein
MDEGRSTDFGKLPPSHARHVDDLCRRFEAEWRAGRPARIEDYLTAVDAPRRSTLLHELLALELELRARRGERPTAQEYRERFPAQSDLVDALFDDLMTQAFVESQSFPPAPPRAPAPNPKPLPATIGRFAMPECLGGGGQGSAFLARDPDLGHLVVLKRYHGGANAAALKEGQALTRIRSRHTAQCYGVECADGELYLVMEYIPGRSLAAILAKAPPTPDAAAHWIEQVAEGLEAVHACGLLHRDLKPSNIIVGDDGVPRLVDFGLAAHLGSKDLQETSGTAPYMAPEQARGQWERIDFRTDVYGLGATLYALLTGVPPHRGGSTTDSLTHARQGSVTSPRARNPAVPRSLERIVQRALAADPAQRYATAGEFRQALRRYRLRHRRRAAIGLGSVALLVLVILGLWLWPRPVPQPLITPPAPLSGELTVRVWSPAGGIKRGWKVDDPGALPVLAGERVHLEAHLSRPAYAYLLWLDGQGQVASLYPWRDRGFGSRLAREPAITVLHSPAELDRGWPMEGQGGLETALLLVRPTPLPPATDLAALIGRLPPAPLRDPREVAVRGFDPGQPTDAINRSEHRRGLGAEADRVDDPLLEVMEKLRPHFDVIRAVSFAYRGE